MMQLLTTAVKVEWMCYFYYTQYYVARTVFLDSQTTSIAVAYMPRRSNTPGPRLNIKTIFPSWNRDSHYTSKMASWRFYLYDGIPTLVRHFYTETAHGQAISDHKFDLQATSTA